MLQQIGTLLWKYLVLPRDIYVDMKKITVPEPVFIVDHNNSQMLDQSGNPICITFYDFVRNTLLVDPKFGKTMADIMSAVDIKQKLSEKPEEKTIIIENADWERLNAVANEPSSGYNPVIVVQLISFLKAIKDAA